VRRGLSVGFVIDYRLIEELPMLAWLARLDPHAGMIFVFHGSAVECRDEWMVEGVWDDDFEQGNFHRSEHFFGSGLRVEGESVYFATSSAATDRLMYCEHQGKLLVSNSLIMLLAVTGATLDENHDYHREILSIKEGIDNYEKEFTIKHPEIRCFYQVIYETMVFSGGGIVFEKRGDPRPINSFDHYLSLLKEILERIKDNYESITRRIPLTAFTTLSSGYDSTAVSCLVKDLGVTTCFTGSRLELPLHLCFYKRVRDDGALIARSLGLDIQYLDSRRSSVSEDELYFLAADHPKFSTKAWSEIGLHSMAVYIERNYSPAVVFTGNYGDLIWDVNINEEYITDQIKQASGPDMGLSPIRLKSGFFQVAVPYILGRNFKDIAAISRSPELEPWRVNNPYDRPIPRRIAESYGVDRHLFGRHKVFLMDTYMWPVNAHLRKEFFEYLKEYHRINPWQVYVYFNLDQLAKVLQVLFRREKAVNLKKLQRIIFSREVDLYYLMNCWAKQILSIKTASILSKADARLTNRKPPINSS
jgi:hypothetical protein